MSPHVRIVRSPLTLSVAKLSQVTLHREVKKSNEYKHASKKGGRARQASAASRLEERSDHRALHVWYKRRRRPGDDYRRTAQLRRQRPARVELDDGLL